jgi:hypothetical protein
MLTFLLFIKVGLLYGRVGAGAGAASKFLPGAGATLLYVMKSLIYACTLLTY